MKLEWNGAVVVRRWLLMQRLEEPVALVVTSQENRCGVGCIEPEPVEPIRVIKQRNAVALSMEMIGGCETDQSGAEDENGL
jgi:hypothetical protein